MSVCISFDFSATCVQRITLNEEAIKFNINDDNVLDFIKNGKVLTTVFGKELLFVLNIEFYLIAKKLFKETIKKIFIKNKIFLFCLKCLTFFIFLLLLDNKF